MILSVLSNFIVDKTLLCTIKKKTQLTRKLNNCY